MISIDEHTPPVIDAMGREILVGDIVVMLNNGMQVGRVLKLNHYHTHPVSITQGQWQQAHWCLKLNDIEKMLPIWVLSDFKPIQ